MTDTNDNIKKLDGLTPTEKRMATGTIPFLLISYCLPTMFSMFMSSIYTVVDRFWIGKLPTDISTLALTGVGVSVGINNILTAVGMLLGVGGASRISISLGRGDKDRAEKILNNVFILAILFYLIILFISIFAIKPILTILGASDATLPYALTYAKTYSRCSIFYLIGISLNHCIRATGRPKVFAISQVIGAVVNMILDPIFLFHFNLGTRGIALATICGQICMLITVLNFYSGTNSLLRLKKKLMKLDLSICKDVILVGMSPFFTSAASTIVLGVLNSVLKYYGNLELGNGDIAVGSMSVINSIYLLFFVPVLGINQGAQPIIGFNYGRKDYKRVKGLFKWSFIYSFFIGLIATSIIVGFANEIIYLFNKNELFIETATKGIRIFLITLSLACAQSCSANFFQALGRAKISLGLSVLRQIVLLIPLYLILPTFFGLKGVWIAGPTSDTLAFIITMYFVSREFRYKLNN